MELSGGYEYDLDFMQCCDREDNYGNFFIYLIKYKLR